MAKRLLIGLVVAMLFAFHPCAFADESAGINVTDVKVEGLYCMDPDELLYLLAIERGGTVYPDTITQGIKRAFLKGVFDSISVEDEGGGVLSVKVREKDRVERVTISSVHLSSNRLVAALGIKRGDYITPGTMDSHIDSLREYIHRSGFDNSVVTYDMHRIEMDNKVELVVAVQEGQPRVIENIRVIGRPDREVLGRMNLSVGDRFDGGVLSRDIQRLQEYYSGRGYVWSIVGPAEFVDGKLIIPVLTGRRIKYTFKGNDAFPDKLLIGLMPFVDEGEVNDDLVGEAVERIVKFYGSYGYSTVQVAPVVKSRKGNVDLVFYINEGETMSVRSVTVYEDGLRAEGRVADIINNREGKTFLPSKMSDDIKIIKDFYAALGYRGVEVDEPAISIDEGVDIAIYVHTGAKTLISSVEIKGNVHISDNRIRKALLAREGQPYNEVDIVESRRAAQAICRADGYYHCSVSVMKEFSKDGARLVFVTNEDDLFFFGKTIISGNHKTSLQTIRRQLRYADGDPMDISKLLQTRQRLMGMGIFTRVETDLIDAADNVIDVHIKVIEAKPGSVDFGIGYGEYEGARTFFELGYRNIFGSGNSGSLRLEASTLWKRYILNYFDPYFWETDIRSRTFLVHEERKQKNIDTGEVSYRILKNSLSSGLEKDVTRHVTLSAYYEYSIVETYEVMSDVILSKEDTGTLAISSVTPSIHYNSLNDPFDPSRGILTGLTVKDASSQTFSESEFTKVTAQFNAYTRATRRIVPAISLRGGMATPRGGAADLPVVERFYLGGRNSVRGFTQDSLGPVGPTGIPIGGNFFLLGSLEFRVRITGAWRTVLFGDCGNVWLARSEVSTGDLRCASGAGIRYKTPVGPIRLDYGYKLDRQPGESKGEFHFSIGHAF